MSAYLYIDLNRDITSSGKKSIGKIIFKRNVVRRKFADQVIWQDLKKNTLLINNDTVFTGSLSDTTIVLKDGTVIQVGEDSMVLLDISGKKSNINLSRGFIHATRSTSGSGDTVLTIKSGDKKITMEEGAIKLTKKGDKDVSLVVQKGKADVSFKGEKKTVKEGEAAVISGKIDIKKIPVELIEPSDNKHFFIPETSAEKIIEFRWRIDEKKLKGGELMFELSASRSFSRVIKRIPLSGLSAELPLGEGVYYWRVSPAALKKDVSTGSEIRKFSLLKQKPFVIIKPVNGSKIEYVDELPVINFNWQAKEYAASYRLEISGSGDFSKIIKSVDTGVTSISLQPGKDMEDPGTATYYWRLKTDNSIDNWPEQVSPAYSFSIVKKTRLDPPVLVSPRDSFRINQLLFGENKAMFSWSAQDDIKKCLIFFSRDKDFKDIINKYTTENNFFLLREKLPAGKYFWRVKGISLKGQETDYSASRSFYSAELESLALDTPENSSKYNIYQVLEDGIRFSWIKDPNFNNYSFELSRDKSFKSIIHNKPVSSGAYILSQVKPGKFFWRVRILSGEKKEIAVSETREITIDDKLPDPVISFPQEGININMLKKQVLEFSWKKIHGANSYEFKLYQLEKVKGRKVKKIVTSYSTRELKLKIEELNKLDVGSFLWTLRGIRKDSAGKVISSSREIENIFSINLGDPKAYSGSNIEIISPLKQATK